MPNHIPIPPASRISSLVSFATLNLGWAKVNLRFSLWLTQKPSIRVCCSLSIMPYPMLFPSTLHAFSTWHSIFVSLHCFLRHWRRIHKGCFERRKVHGCKRLENKINLIPAIIWQPDQRKNKDMTRHDFCVQKKWKLIAWQRLEHLAKKNYAKERFEERYSLTYLPCSDQHERSRPTFAHPVRINACASFFAHPFSLTVCYCASATVFSSARILVRWSHFIEQTIGMRSEASERL